MTNPDIALFLPSLSSGGAVRIMIRIAEYLQNRGRVVELVVAKKEGEFSKFTRDVETVGLNGRLIRSFSRLSRYVRQRDPDVLLSTTHAGNIIATWSVILARTDTELILREPTILTHQKREFTKAKDRLIPPLVKLTYPYADRYIAISRGVGQELTETIGIPSSKIDVIYNPIFTPDIEPKSEEPVDHPWFSSSHPVVLGAGRLTPQKDFPTLLRSFDTLHDHTDARLVILGEGSERDSLESLAYELGIKEFVDFYGYVDNPYKFMRRADVFVLSSAWEGFGNVIVEALSCGTTVVSTDCESGPNEILQDGEFGYLTPVSNPTILANTIQTALDSPMDPHHLRNRAMDFSEDAIMPKYEKSLFDGVQGWNG